MKIGLATAWFVVSALLAPAAALASDDRDADRAHPVTFVKDSAITAKIKTKLAAEKMSSLARVRVDTDEAGAVVLSGQVKTQEDIDKAAEIARNTKGVTSVTNHLKIRKPKKGH